MENYRRREFIKSLGLISLSSFVLSNKAFPSGFNATFELPPLPFQVNLLTGKEKGGRVLIIGGIHGNEPGAYKAADIIRNLKIKKGEVIVAPRTNFISILTNRRGYNGDMNRKFAQISKEDPDYPYVMKIKELISTTRPNILLTLHDGFGFHSVNKKAWGQCIVIDEERYRGIELGKVAKTVSQRVNSKMKKRRWKIPVFNTHTFKENTEHPEQRRSLTYYSLKECLVPAVCLEVSKQLPNLYYKVKFHLMMINEFFKLYGVETDPPIKFIMENLNQFLKPKVTYWADLLINGRKVRLLNDKTFKLPKGSTVKFLSFSGTDGTNGITEDLNSNLRKFGIKRRVSIKVKDDFKELFTLRFIIS